MDNLIKLEIKNKNYGKLKDANIYITPELKYTLENIASKQYGNLFTALETIGFRAGKHLVQVIQNKLGVNAVIILSHEKSNLDGNTVVINYDNYRKIGSGLFFSLYRQTGMETVYRFLSKELPTLAPPASELVSRSQTKKVIEALPSAKNLTRRDMNVLFENTAKIIRGSKVDVNALKELTAATNHAHYKNKISECKVRLDKRLPETIGKNSWQTWIYKNNWMFGTRYLDPISKEKVGFNQIPDFLFPTVDGFLDVLEIKVPHDIELIKKDKHHTGAYYWDPKTSEAIGQVANYLHEIEKNQLQIAQNIKRNCDLELSVIKPRAVILAGRSNDWKIEKSEALRKLNFTLHGIEVMSYDHLLERANNLIRMFDERPPQKSQSS